MYDFEKGRQNIREIFRSNVDVESRNIIPKADDTRFTFENAYYGWVSAIFVDIRNSTELFANDDKKKVSKIIRAFTSEIIGILESNDSVREIGIRGDCVYAIYATPQKGDVYNVADLTFWINTYISMLNKELVLHRWNPISVGIGMATDQELVVKAGKFGSGINSLVWIGKAVTYASKLSGIANKGDNKVILFSDLAYTNFIEQLCKENSDSKDWFTEDFNFDVGIYHMANIVKTKFNDWIKEQYGH